jgi:hypothetical protein
MRDLFPDLDALGTEAARRNAEFLCRASSASLGSLLGSARASARSGDCQGAVIRLRRASETVSKGVSVSCPRRLVEAARRAVKKMRRDVSRCGR